MIQWPWRRRQRDQPAPAVEEPTEQEQRDHAEQRWREEQTERYTLDEVRRSLAEIDLIKTELEARKLGLIRSKRIHRPREV